MGLIQELIGGLFGDEGFAEVREDIYDRPALADLLPYRVYDPETGFYFNENTTGFVAAIGATITPPMVENFHSALTGSIPTGGGIQVLNWSSPDISRVMSAWARARVAGNEVSESMVTNRIGHFDRGRFGSEAQIRSIPTTRRRIVAGWISGEPGITALKDLEQYRTALLGALNIPKEGWVLPGQLIGLVGDILHAEVFEDGPNADYSEDVPINTQVPGSALRVLADSVSLAGEPKMSVRAASVAQFPKEWRSQMGALLFGSPDVISDRPLGPVLISLCGMAIPAQKATGGLLSKRAKHEHAKKSGFARFTRDPDGKQEELARLSEELDGGERLFEATMGVLSYAKGGADEARSAMTELQKIFRRAGFRLRQEKFLQLPFLLSSLPLGANEAYLRAMRKLQRVRQLKGSAMAALSPFYSEWTGNTAGAGMLLMGRQGEVFTWSNFVSEGNYNVSVVGKSGAGKSVFMQELINSIWSGGGRTLVIDDGYSFKTTCEILGGTHVAMDGSQEIRLNPFSMLAADKMASKEYGAEAVELVTRVISTMAALGEQREGRVAGIEEEEISGAVRKVWTEKGPDGEVTDVLAHLLARSKEESRLSDVCQKLGKFAKGGAFGDYFEGRSTVNVDAALTVVELSELKTQPDLEQVVLQLVMFLGTELMFKTDRSVPVAIVIDEAWDLLKGQGTAKFIEGVVRRARKYTGALITGTQSIDDYYQNPAAEVCLQNSDWTVFLAQKPETIERLAKDGRLSLPDGFGARLKSVTSVPGGFSEMAIKGSQGWIFARLALDPFSLAVFSSKGATVEALRKRQAAGMGTVAAINDMIERGEVS